MGLSLTLACGREDIELSYRSGVVSPVDASVVGIADGVADVRINTELPADDCSASVPAGLVAPKPPMGWNGWNKFNCDPALNEAKVKASADAMLASGMALAGYEYVNLDDCWEVDRGPDGQRVVDPVRLPGGMKNLASYIHARGLKLGVFAPPQACGAIPGGAGHEDVDVKIYEGWEADYLKYRWCATSPSPNGRVNYERMAAALAAARRRIVFSIAYPPFAEWMASTGQLWRTGSNVDAAWKTLLGSIDAVVPLAAYTRPGAFNDADMLQVGNGALTENEGRAHFSVWSIFSSPLLAGNDITAMSEATRTILTNREVIELDQDPLGLQGALIRTTGEVQVFAKPLAQCGARGVVLLNRGDVPTQVNLTWPDIWLVPGGAASIRDLWAHADLAPSTIGIAVTVPAHDAVALKIIGTEPPLPQGHPYLSDLSWTYAVSAYGPVEFDRSNGERDAGDGKPFRIRGRTFSRGLGVHGPSLLRYRLGQACSRFTAEVGVDDETSGGGLVYFQVWADGEKLFDSGLMSGTSPPKQVDLNIEQKRDLRLFVGIGDSDVLDHADWADARLTCSGGATP